VDDKEQSRLRQQARDWLKADLALWDKQADSADLKLRESVHKRMKQWQTDPDLTGVRDKDDLAKLPTAERDAWQKLWAEVAAILAKTAEPK
jgi:hypothetical protein